jgi:transcriptional regulator with PAS, ATPase and Fis domain
MRELINLCERLVVMSDAEVIEPADLPPDVVLRAGKTEQASWPGDLTLGQAIETTERTLLLKARERHGNQSAMAKALGVDQSTIARKLKKYGIP